MNNSLNDSNYVSFDLMQVMWDKVVKILQWFIFTFKAFKSFLEREIVHVIAKFQSNYIS